MQLGRLAIQLGSRGDVLLAAALDPHDRAIPGCGAIDRDARLEIRRHFAAKFLEAIAQPRREMAKHRLDRHASVQSAAGFQQRCHTSLRPAREAALPYLISPSSFAANTISPAIGAAARLPYPAFSTITARA